MRGEDMPVELLSAEARLIADAFLELSAGRGGGFGPSPIGWLEMEAWARLTGTTLSVWAVRLLRQLDGLFLKHAAKAQERK